MSQEIPLYGDDFCELELTDVFGAESDSDVPSDTPQNSQELPLYTGDTLESQQSISHRRSSDSNDTLQDNEKSNSQTGSNDSNDNSNLDINPRTSRKSKGQTLSRYLHGQFSDSSSSSENGESDDEDEDPDDTDFIDYEGRGTKFLEDNPPQWTENVQSFTVHPFTRAKHGPNLPEDWDYNCDPVEYFKLFFTDELCKEITEYTNSYAVHAINLFKAVSPGYVDKDWSLDGSDNLTTDELLAYIGANIIFGLNPCKRLKAAFSTDPYVNNQGVRSHFTIKRFLKIGNYFCCCDKSQEKPKGHKDYDKMFKVKKLIQHCNSVFPKYYSFSQHVALDESIIKTKSRVDNLTYNPMKPVKRGIKVFSLCDANDSRFPYLLSFEPYMGSDYHKTTINGKTFETVKRLTKPLFGTYARVYVDNYYTSVPLFCHLQKNKVYAVGTLRHRKGLPPQLKKHKSMVRGKHRVWQDERNRNLTCTIWQDTKLVSFLSTCADPTVVTTCVRRIGSQYRRIYCPSVSKLFNFHYKAVDLYDYSLRNFCTGRKSVRSTKYYISFCIDAMITNAYILFMMTSSKQKPKTYSQLHFRLELGKKLMGNFTCRKYYTLAPAMYLGPNQEHVDLTNHYHGKIPNLKGARICRAHKKFFGFNKRTRLGCPICKISLCYECHYMYHNEGKFY